MNVAVRSLVDLFLQTAQHAFAVLDDDGKLYGIVSLTDYRRIPQDDNLLTVKDIATRSLVTAFPDETLRVVMHRMAPRYLSRVPVVSRDDQHLLLGVIRRNDIVRAYQIETVRRGSVASRLAGYPPGTQTVQLSVPKDTPLMAAPACRPMMWLHLWQKKMILTGWKPSGEISRLQTKKVKSKFDVKSFMQDKPCDSRLGYTKENPQPYDP